ncbi:SpoIVB peptidase [Clostridium thermobutyricum]|uniref:Stage IV sporulation protein B n=2 Tax=Clostridium thermobutyricum TaxID=29372 RepID=N9WGI7_9CLOT|nr:SpoIVB peptidase [Clostridium thermobutyricum]ENZ01995.1 stage IV sporulation protein B [Clostridium thermobutyricum]OPX47864.1 SpoIVB peptidase precursor [Clostridium thermobutyricum DSM 4928]
MKKRIVRSIGLVFAILFVMVLASVFTLKDIPNEIYTSKENVQSISVFKQNNPLNTVKYDGKNINIEFMGLFSLKKVEVHKIKDLEVYPGGDSIGVRLSSSGVLVVGFSDVIINGEKSGSPAKNGGIIVGDFIMKVNGNTVLTSKEVGREIEKSNSDKVKLTIDRKGEVLEKEIKGIKEGDKYKIGLWVRDSAAGVGTMTFYDKKTNKFGALGHPITDGDTNEIFRSRKGDLYEASIISLRKGEKGNPGELKGIFMDEDKPVGEIEKNTECGIFGNGKMKDKENISKPMKVGFREEVKVGKAKIITTISGNEPKEYEIEIMKKLDQDTPGPKSMIIKVTDEELLKQTGGIIQGMSGSPIIQDGKLIGAVTHVLINKPDTGYGIYIDWMLKDAGIIG